jgi:nucleoside-diphosphate-sugar epimerase
MADDAAQLTAFCQEWRPAGVIHMAADVRKGSGIDVVDGLVDANLRLPLRMMAAAKASGAEFFVNITTFSTASDTEAYAPQTLYAASKQACEDLLTYYHQSEDIQVIHLAFYDVYGPGQPHARFLNEAIQAVIQQRPFSTTKGEQEICFVYVMDAVSAVIHAVKTREAIAASGVNKFCVFGPEVFVLSSVTPRIARAIGKPAPMVVAERPYRKNEIMKVAPRWCLLPGWQPVIDFELGIKMMMREST